MKNRLLLILLLLSSSYYSYAQYSAVGIIGTATSGSWDFDTFLSVNPANSSIWTLSDVPLLDGELKFRADTTWDINWGGDTFPSGVLVPNGLNIQVTQGTYDITVDFTQNTYSLVNTASAGIIAPKVRIRVDNLPPNTPQNAILTANAPAYLNNPTSYGQFFLDTSGVYYELLLPDGTIGLDFNVFIDNNPAYKALESNGSESTYYVSFTDSTEWEIIIEDWNFVPSGYSFDNPLLVDSSSTYSTYDQPSFYQYVSSGQEIVDIKTDDYSINKNLRLFVNNTLKLDTYGYDIGGAVELQPFDTLKVQWMVSDAQSNIQAFDFNFNIAPLPKIIVRNIPANTPSDTKIYVAGDYEGWRFNWPDKHLIYNVDSNYYEVELPLTATKNQFTFFLKGGTKFREIDQQDSLKIRTVDLQSSVDNVFFVDDIFAWSAIPTPQNSCETALPSQLGDNVVESTAQWFVFTAPEDGDYYIKESSNRLSNAEYMAEDVSLYWDCNDTISFNAARGLVVQPLAQGETVYIKWEHYLGDDVAFDWRIERAGYFMMSDANGFRSDRAVEMQRVGPSQYYLEQFFDVGNSGFSILDQTQSFIAYDTINNVITHKYNNSIPMDVDEAGIYGITVDFSDGSYSYEFVESYETPPVTFQPQYWQPNQQIKMILDLRNEGNIQHMDSAYIWTWIETSDSVYAPLLQTDFGFSDPSAKMTKESEGVYSYTFTPTTLFNVEDSIISNYGINFLMKNLYGSDKTDDIGPFFPVNEPMYTVSFTVDLSVYIEEGKFDPNADQVILYSNFTENHSFYEETMFNMGNGMYSKDLTNILSAGNEYKYIIRKQDGDIEELELRTFVNTGDNVVIVSDVFDNKLTADPLTTVVMDISHQIDFGNFIPDENLVKIQYFESDTSTIIYPMMKVDDQYFSWSFRQPEGSILDFNFIIVDSQTDSILMVEDTVRTLIVSSGNPNRGFTFNDELYQTSVVTFNVDMRVFILEEKFDPLSDYVEVVGSLNNWGNYDTLFLSDDDLDGVYSYSTELLVGDYEYKYRINSSWDVGMHDSGPNRIFTLGPNEDVSLYDFFDNKFIPNPEVVLSVNMSEQVTQGNFDAGSQEVFIKLMVDSSYVDRPLVVNEDGNYETSLYLLDTLGDYQYYFYYINSNGDSLSKVEEENSRTFTVRGGQQVQLHWFNDEEPVEKITATWTVNMNPGIITQQFDPNTGKVEILGSFNGWASAVELQRVDQTSVYTTSMDLPSAMIYYKVLVDGVEEVFLAQDQSNNRSHFLTVEDNIISAVYKFEETIQVEEEQIETVTQDDGTVNVEVDSTLFAELEGTVTYQAMLADGSELPEWVIFDPETLTFTVDPSKVPAGTRLMDAIADLDIIILANDESGKSVAVEVTLPTETIISDYQDEQDDEDVNSLSDDLLKLSVYPSHLSNFTMIYNPTSQSLSYQLLDMSGKQIEKGHSSSSKIKLDMENLPEGMYFIHMVNQYGNYTQKVVKK
ncbi:T9SS type A sorting domain-containing protein [Flammeovirga sp. MY04]|uniref:T9SS type A sorting domain-containing protein n=1 Tax=Flammeovirga sp. MY04 TaxID=1191459 RepID=UPI0008062DA7|nr:T9SS type A sorting domain-containing protein [Flammeovirga sp. MY04]ANQ49824.1 T9SS type A sorting domain-containing protein [Flammeovirga sp. MY04]